MDYDSEIERQFVEGTISRIAQKDPQFAAKIRNELSRQGLSGLFDGFSDIVKTYAQSRVQNKLAEDAAETQARIMKTNLRAQARKAPAPVKKVKLQQAAQVDTYTNTFTLANTPWYLWALLAGGIGYLAFGRKR